MSLALIDYGAGNLQSVRNALKAAGAEDVVVTADPDAVRHADRIVLPGVGAFAHCMIALTAIDGMVDALNDRVIAQGHPFLGICVGMQLMAEAGEAYFLHSYAFEGTDVLAQTDHGGPIVAAIGRDNFAGVQFHPEKSQRYGLALLSRFLEWQP